MQSASTPRTDFLDELEDIPSLNVVIVYADPAAAQHARDIYACLVTNLGKEFEFHQRSWAFSTLDDLELARAAAEDALQADIVVIASRGDQDLPTWIKDWMKLWTGRQGAPAALVALFGPECTGVSRQAEIVNYLREVARTSGMDFFAEPEFKGMAAQSVQTASETASTWAGRGL